MTGMILNRHLLVNTNVCDWNKDTRELVAEASDIRYHGGYRLYHDSCDYGLWVQSHHTNKVLPFIYYGADGSDEERFDKWFFRNDEHNLTLVIYND